MHRQQPEKYKQNANLAPTLEKILRMPMLMARILYHSTSAQKLNSFQILLFPIFIYNHKQGI